MYLHIENTGKFPLHYTIHVPNRHPSVLYMSQLTSEGGDKKRNLTGRTMGSRTGKKSGRSGKTEDR